MTVSNARTDNGNTIDCYSECILRTEYLSIAIHKGSSHYDLHISAANYFIAGVELIENAGIVLSTIMGFCLLSNEFVAVAYLTPQ
jgi:hypothetical protein